MIPMNSCSRVLLPLGGAEGVPAHVATVGGHVLRFFWDGRCGGACSVVTRTPFFPLSLFCKGEGEEML